MKSWLIEALLARTARERALFAVLVFVVLPVAVVMLGLLPLQQTRDAALMRLEQADATRLWVAQQAQTMTALARPAQAEVLQTPIGTSAVEDLLIAANLRPVVSSLGVSDSGEIEIQFDSVTFTRLANWLSASDGTWGYAISQFRFEETTSPGKVSASVTLTPLG